MSLWSERCKADRTRRSWNGASHVAGGRARRKFLFGMRFFGNVAGGMRRARSSLSRRKKRVSAIVTTFKPGWTCMMPRKEERQRFPKVETHHLQSRVLLSPSASSNEIAVNILAEHPAIHDNLCNS